MAPSEKSNLLPTNANGLQSTSVPPSDSTRMVLYSSHFFAQWAERMWEFSISLFLIAIAPQSIFLVSTYGLFQCLMIIMTGSYAGNYIDTTARMRAVRIILLLQNGSVVICSLFCYWLLFAESDGDIDESHSHDLVPPAWAAKMLAGVPKDSFSVMAIVLIHIFGALGAVFSQASTVAIEKDWVVVMSRGSSTWLRETNVMMRQIDLGCKVMAPVMAGVVMSYGNISEAALCVGLFNCLAIVVEFICTKKVYDSVGALAEAREVREAGAGKAKAGSFLHSLQAFFSQNVWGAGVALSLLYLNVLSFGSLMTAYLSYRGMDSSMIGFTRGVSSTIGLLGTFVFHYSSPKLGLNKTGLWSIWMQAACVGVAFLSIYIADSNTSLSMLVGGVACSRVGLWVFDLSVTQMFQEEVAEYERGVVGSMQSVLNQFFQLCSFAMGIVWTDPAKFNILICISFSGLLLASVLYSLNIAMK